MTDRAMPDFETYYTIWQDDDEQAGASDLGQAAHFAMIYGQDGPVELQTDVTFTFQGHLTREEIRGALSAAPSGDGEAVAFWVVIASRGEYSDRSEWVVSVHVSESEGQAEVERLDALDRETKAALPPNRIWLHDDTTHYLSGPHPVPAQAILAAMEPRP